MSDVSMTSQQTAILMQLEMILIEIQAAVLNHALNSVLILVKPRAFQTVTIMLVYKTGRKNS
jgi:hypothetical protein